MRVLPWSTCAKKIRMFSYTMHQLVYLLSLSRNLLIWWLFLLGIQWSQWQWKQKRKEKNKEEQEKKIDLKYCVSCEDHLLSRLLINFIITIFAMPLTCPLCQTELKLHLLQPELSIISCPSLTLCLPILIYLLMKS